VKAVVQERYGPPRGSVVVREVDRPAPGDGQALVHVRAACVNISDAILAYTPLVFRLIAGQGGTRPKVPTPGKDAAGVIAQVGPGVGDLRPGDKVFGRSSQAYAEYALADAGELLPLPDALTFEQAAAIGISAMTALQAMRDHGAVRRGHRVIVNGASGGVGVYAVQIAKAFGAHVTGVCSTRNVSLVESLGADRVIDYMRDDLTAGGERYDVILDNAGNHTPSEYARLLAPGGRLLLNGGGIAMGRGDGIWRALIAPTLAARRLGQPGLMPVLKWTRDDLAVLKRMVEAGEVRPVIDRTYSLGEAAEAMEAAISGRARGKIVIVVE
jgi:NADPH:quinone reductase-like Zn-dependent oxidoreductase